ncbi:elongation factor 1-alpha [Clavispora lusitaniae ATCC 42720]|uniref:Elongation factor 1-alpha n=1 Tax=Clavispora lusitaniae (strain ATCC 42720) TaxID=306902 RepID=C4XX02_CLAL4|nr:elongation factor 1-alpha [Clavispora lusitaniae ATCC 42720]EEQ36353.1 elongation factor 1-alpha [Clavispora lusitaniae ATCC 42720]
MLTSRPSKHNVFLPTTSRSKHNVFLPTSPSKHTSDFRHYIIHFRITSFLLTDSLLLGSLLSSLGNLTGLVGLLNSLDDTNSNGLSHVSDSESTQWWVVGESLNTHWLGWDHLDDSSVTGLDELWLFFQLLTGSSVDLLDQGVELTSNVGSVTVQNWRVTRGDLTWVVQDNDLSSEGSSSLWWVVLGVTTDVTSSDFLDGNVLDVETNVVTWDTLSQLFVVHFHGLDFSGDTSWSKGDNHTGLDDTGLNSTDWHSTNTTNLVDILQWQSQWLVGWSRRWLNGVNGLQQGLTGGLTRLGLLLPTLVPWAVGGWLNHVVTVPTRDWDEWNSLRVVTNLLDEVRGFLDDFLESRLVPLDGVHLVDSNNQSLDTQGVSQQSVLSGLTVLRDTGFELTDTTSDNQDSTVSLGSTSDHVLDEISVTWSVNDGNVVLWSLELPQSDIDGDTSFSLSLQLVQNPSVLERTLTQFSGFLLELFNSSLVNTTTLVNQVTGGGRLTGIDVTDNNDVDVSFLLTHCVC